MALKDWRFQRKISKAGFKSWAKDDKIVHIVEKNGISTFRAFKETRVAPFFKVIKKISSKDREGIIEFGRLYRKKF